MLPGSHIGWNNKTVILHGYLEFLRKAGNKIEMRVWNKLEIHEVKIRTALL